jgi:hypothetical protein
VLAHDAVTAELICDGFHVHPAMCRLAIAAKSVGGVMAITDGTAGAGLRSGTLTRLGGRTIRVSDQAALLEDGTLAGSTLTMDRAFRNIVTMFGMSIPEAATMCSTTPARATRFDAIRCRCRGQHRGSLSCSIALFGSSARSLPANRCTGERRASTDFTLLWREPYGVAKRAGQDSLHVCNPS